jgi:hypothetical protein
VSDRPLLILAERKDPLAFLKGARLPLFDAVEDTGRWEWCDDLLLRIWTSPDGLLITPYAQTAGNLKWLALALDPAHEDTGRFLDRKIAEKVGLFQGRGQPELSFHAEDTDCGAEWRLRESCVISTLKKHPRRRQDNDFKIACEVLRRPELAGGDVALARKLLIEALY